MKKQIPLIMSVAVIVIVFLLNAAVFAENPQVSIVAGRSGVSVEYGIRRLQKVLLEKDIDFERCEILDEAKGNWIVVAGTSGNKGTVSSFISAEKIEVARESQALTIKRTSFQQKPVLVIYGFDDTGLMYGLLEVARQVKFCNDLSILPANIKEISEKPDLQERAISIYTMNRAYWESRFYDENYWAAYLDMLAENRFNSMVIIFGYENGGFLAPCYPYFFNVNEFPDVQMIGITAEQQQKNTDALHRLIKMAHERGIRFTVGIWDHIYRGGVQGGGIPGTRNAPDQPVPGLVWGVTAENLIAYTKAALTEFVHTFPEIDAIQFRMHNESGLKNEEKVGFWADVFKMMKNTVPNLQLDLRAKELPDEVIQSAMDSGLKFRITTKYWMEQMGMPFHLTQINPEKSQRRHSYADMLRYPKKYDMHWRLWNGGTARILLWGDPEYVRRFSESAHLYNGSGYEVNEPLTTKMEAQPHDAKPFQLLNSKYVYYDYEFERYWHFFQVFGRIGYNPEVVSDIWKNEFESRFGKEAASFLEEALHKASWILPRIIASVYPYSGFPMTRGWAEKQRLGDLKNYAKNTGSDLQQFATFVEEADFLISGHETAKILPSMTGRWFEETATEINRLIDNAEKAIGEHKNNEFISTITDLKILSGLALYHSKRIPAAVSYCIFEITKDPNALDEAIRFEKSAVEAWKTIVDAAADVYTEDLMMGVRNADLCGHWKDELVKLEEGLKQLINERNNIAESAEINAPKYRKSEKCSWYDDFKVEHTRTTEIPVGQPLKISVKVSSPSGIKWVKLNHRSLNQDVDYKTVIMNSTGAPGVFEATVPSNEINPEWDYMYLISVMNNDNHGIIYPDFSRETPYVVVHLIR